VPLPGTEFRLGPPPGALAARPWPAGNAPDWRAKPFRRGAQGRPLLKALSLVEGLPRGACPAEPLPFTGAGAPAAGPWNAASPYAAVRRGEMRRSRLPRRPVTTPEKQGHPLEGDPPRRTRARRRRRAAVFREVAGSASRSRKARRTMLQRAGSEYVDVLFHRRRTRSLPEPDDVTTPGSRSGL
jgi:hypothetical protein